MTKTSTSTRRTPPIAKGSREDAFSEEVLKASQEKPIVVSFWASWCAPSLKLTKLVEEAIRQFDKPIGFVKVNIEDGTSLMMRLLQMGLPLRRLPLVAGFYQGEILDLFQGLRPKTGVEQFLSEFMAKTKTGPSPSDALIFRGYALLEGADPERAQKTFGLVLDEDLNNERAWGGIIASLISIDDESAARAALADVPPPLQDQPEIQIVRTILELKSKGRAVAEKLEEVKSLLSRDPQNHTAQFEMSLLFNSAGKKREAVDLLVEILKADKDWHEGAARKQLIQYFEAWGCVDPATIYGHHLLSEMGL